MVPSEGGPGYGVVVYLTSLGNDLVVDFGTGQTMTGIWKWLNNTTWKRLDNRASLAMAMGDIDGTVGAWGFARGGMGSVASALHDSFLASGGQVRVNAGVSKFIVQNGKVKGMQLENGETVMKN